MFGKADPGVGVAGREGWRALRWLPLDDDRSKREGEGSQVGVSGQREERASAKALH